LDAKTTPQGGIIASEFTLIRLVGLERELGELLGREVQILPEPIRKPRLRAEVERDRV
jgi:predicted nucleotidyltransferase